MPLIKAEKPAEKTKISATIRTDIAEEITQYCEFAELGMDGTAIFLEQAAEIVFKKDKDWRDHKKAQATATETS